MEGDNAGGLSVWNLPQVFMRMVKAGLGVIF
jgi:hypothetical protein